MKLGDGLSLVRQKMDHRGVIDGANHFCGGEEHRRDQLMFAGAVGFYTVLVTDR